MKCVYTDGVCTSIIDDDGDTDNDDDMTCIMRGGNTGGSDTRFCDTCVGKITNRIHNDIACSNGGSAGPTTCVSKMFPTDSFQQTQKGYAFSILS